MAARLRNRTSDVAENVAKHVQKLVETEGMSGKTYGKRRNSSLLALIPRFNHIRLARSRILSPNSVSTFGGKSRMYVSVSCLNKFEGCCWNDTVGSVRGVKQENQLCRREVTSMHGLNNTIAIRCRVCPFHRIYLNTAACLVCLCGRFLLFTFLFWIELSASVRTNVVNIFEHCRDGSGSKSPCGGWGHVPLGVLHMFYFSMIMTERKRFDLWYLQ